MFYNMQEPWRHDSQWKKPDTKDHKWHDSIYMKCPEAWGRGSGRNGGETANGISFWGNEVFWN